jgi:hypothetical protein
MKAGGITPSDMRDVGLSLMFVHSMDEFLDSSAQAVVKLEVFSAYVDYTVRCCRTEMDATGLYRKAVPSATISIPGVRLAPTIVEVELDDEDGFDEDKARRDAINSFENVWTNWMELAATIDWAIQDCVKDLPLRKECGCRERDQEQSRRSAIPPRASPAARCLVGVRADHQQHELPLAVRRTAVYRSRFLGAAGLERRLGGLPLDWALWAARHVG